MWLNLGLNKKISVIIGLFLLIICIMAAITIYRLNTLKTEAEYTREAAQLNAVMLAREVDHLKWLGTLRAFALDASARELNIQMDPSRCNLGAWYYGEGRKKAEASFPRIIPFLAQLEAFHSALHASAVTIKNLRAEREFEAAKEVFATTTLPALAGVQDIMYKISAHMEDSSARSKSQFEGVVSESFMILAVGVVISLGIAVFLGLVIARSITSPTIAISRYADQVAGGDYSRKLDMKRKDEIGTLASSLTYMVSTMVKALNEAEEQRREVETSLTKAREAHQEAQRANAAAEKAHSQGMQAAAVRLEDMVAIISSASEELSAQVAQSEEGATSQSSNLAEEASAMEEMNKTVLEVARNASNAAEVTALTRQKAEEGADIVLKVVSSINNVQEVSKILKKDMEVLATQAEAISDIMRVISDIADQTNLLALNAAIEAARAGDAGRGFAVVADEVRKLAEKTMMSTNDVGTAIENIQKSVEQSIGQADRAAELVQEATEQAGLSGAALSEIVKLVDETADKTHSIATASEEQSATSEEINRNIGEISAVSVQTAQAMREASQAVAELARQSSNLVALIEEMKAS